MSIIQMSDSQVVTLRYKVLGEPRVMTAPTVLDGIQLAIGLIRTGAGIPKGVFVGDAEVYSEADINKHWEEQHDKKTA